MRYCTHPCTPHPAPRTTPPPPAPLSPHQNSPYKSVSHEDQLSVPKRYNFSFTFSDVGQNLTFFWYLGLPCSSSEPRFWLHCCILLLQEVVEVYSLPALCLVCP